MAFNDSFGIFGHYAFSSKATHGRAIFESMSDSLGDSYNQDFTSLQSARLYADSMCLASAQYQLDRALNNRDVSKSTELLIQLEKDYKVVPGRTDTLQQRRAFLTAMVRVSRGNSKQVIESALTSLLGSDFVSYQQLLPVVFPTNPGDFGVFSEPNEPIKQFYITSSVSNTGTPIDVAFERIGDSALPVAGEKYTVDPDPRSTIEQVTVISSTSTTVRCIFTRSHEAGTVAVRSYPFWSSHLRYSTIIVKLSIAQDAEKRRKINEIMSRASRGVSQWAIISNQGNFILDSSTNGILGSTALA